MSIVDVARHAVIGVIELGHDAKPVGVVVSPDGGSLYVAKGHGNSVSVIDVKIGKVTATIKVGRRPWGVAISRDGRHLYTANGLSNDLSVIDTRSRRVIKRLTVPAGPWGVAGSN